MKQKQKEQLKEYTFQDLQKVRNEEIKNCYTILNYILNANSCSMADGSTDVDIEGLKDDLDKFERYLEESLN
jgi:Cdc6-like AAA superfamily ATPase